MNDIKVLAFDTGGTVLDWHSGLTAAMTEWGAAHVIERDWHAMANEHGRRSLRWMTNTIDPAFNIDDFHRDVFNELFDENQIGGSPEGSWRESASSSWMVRAASASRSPRTLPLSYRMLTAPPPSF
jgi:2-haloacid dehalogenase